MEPAEQTAAFKPAQAEAWEMYVNETTAARQRYDRVVNDARDRFDAAKAAINASANIAVEVAWEQMQGELSAAYQAYESDTKPARHMRDWCLENARLPELHQ